MGYMGSGLQRWIYTQRPRKFFSKSRTSPGSSFDIGAGGDTKIAGRAGDKKAARERVNRYFKMSRLSREIGLLLLAGIISLLAWLAYTIYTAPAPEIGRDEHLHTRHLEHLRQQNAEERQNAYLLLIQSGDEHFEKRQFEWAIEEYEKASEIFPEAEAPVIRIARSYQSLCQYYGQNCEEAKIYELWAQ